LGGGEVDVPVMRNEAIYVPLYLCQIALGHLSKDQAMEDF
jgi:hypothetical protein